MKRFLFFAGKRVLFTVPQLLAVSVIVFFLIRLLPGDPTYMLAGPYATVERISEVLTEHYHRAHPETLGPSSR